MGEHLAPPAGRNLVVCCDGTGNQVGVNLSNVLKLYRILEKDEAQRVFYDPGVGTVAKLAGWGRMRQKAWEAFALATGYGLDDNILDAYRWLCSTWREGDRIFLFGFSRGAYTVRAVAGMINMIGLLGPDQINITDYALTAYKRAMEEDDLPIAWHFQRISGGRDVSIEFIGVWDTVASVIVPRRDRYHLPSLQFLPYTKQNQRVRVFRQACAIDERRRMFRLYGWRADQEFKPQRFWSGNKIDQDDQQVWFAGVHADIGGGYPESESQLSKFPLIWLIDEAVACGLRVDQALLGHLAYGRRHPNGKHEYVTPNHLGTVHRSLKGAWRLLEWLPKKLKWRRWPHRRSFVGLYLPLAEPRLIPQGSFVHQSAADRRQAGNGYDPVNWPETPVLVGASATPEFSSGGHDEQAD